MTKKLIALLVVLCLLPCMASAAAPRIVRIDPLLEYRENMADASVNADADLNPQYFDSTSNIYRRITYITMERDGTILKTETKTEHVATITYRLYYIINRQGEYVGGGVSSSNGYPAVTAVQPEIFAARATPETDPVWTVSVYPDHTGISYNIRGGVFTLTCNHTIYIYPDGEINVGVPSDVQLLYSYSTTHP